ncbi:MAG: protoheme IX farnesyltransferase [Deltaproteobacteria bacterium]|nr:protoheme IX farnesyltransferase [Deltaproteobacteria bacterium]
MTPSTDSHLVLDVPAPQVRRRAIDYLELTKPRIVVMVLITTAAGFYLGAQGSPNYLILLHTLIGTALTGGGTLALNQLMERHADALMTRTRNRPLPDGRLLPVDALVFGLILTVSGIAYLVWASLWRSAFVTLLIAVTYLLMYTPLKQRTSLCSIVGAIPGALPPVIGWAAVRGSLGIEAWILFTIMFLWQVPHSLAIGWLYREDFAKAKFCLLPVIDPSGKATGRQVVLNCALLFLVGFLPVLVGFAGMWYGITAFLLGGLFFWYGVNFARACSTATARQLLFASLIYLPVILTALALDKL